MHPKEIQARPICFPDLSIDFCSLRPFSSKARVRAMAVDVPSVEEDDSMLEEEVLACSFERLGLEKE